MYMKTTPRLLFVLRYGIGGVMVIAGIVLLITNSGGFGVDGFALGVGAGLSLIMLNFLYRLGVSGDRERDQGVAVVPLQEQDEHGHQAREHRHDPSDAAEIHAPILAVEGDGPRPGGPSGRFLGGRAAAS